VRPGEKIAVLGQMFDGKAAIEQDPVGVQILERSHGWGSHVIEFFAVGTAVVPTKADHVIDAPTMMLSMDG